MEQPKLEKTIFFIISGPSGAGEDSVIEDLKNKINFERVITTVTRSKRRGESEGHPYHFVTVKKFKGMIKNKEFFEWARVYGDYRGATKKEIKRLARKKVLVLWKVDFQGVEAIKKRMPGVLSVLILPPSLKILEQRLIRRGQDSLDIIKKRMPFTKKWLRHRRCYDYVVVNKESELKETIEKVFKIFVQNMKNQTVGY